jgi:hypothetical protein
VKNKCTYVYFAHLQQCCCHIVAIFGLAYNRQVCQRLTLRISGLAAAQGITALCVSYYLRALHVIRVGETLCLSGLAAAAAAALHIT